MRLRDRLRRRPRGALQDHPLPAPVRQVGVEPIGVEPRTALLRVAAEAVVLQDDADAVLDQIRRHEPLGFTAPPGGTLVRRFFALADRLPERYDDPAAEHLRAALSAILNHHAHLITVAMELSAYEWRSERLRLQVESLSGTGVPGQQLERIYAELAAGS